MLCGWIRAHCLGPRTFYYYDQFLLLAAPPASLPGNKSSGVNILMKMLIDVISTGAWGVWGGGGASPPANVSLRRGTNGEENLNDWGCSLPRGAFSIF